MSFNARMIRVGIITVSAAIVANFIPALYVWWAYGVIPSIPDIMKIWAVAAAAYGVSWIVQPLSFFAVVGTAGQYISWVAGTVSTIRVPASTMAQKSAEVEPGTPEGDVISAIGIATSVFVSVGIVTIFVFIGSWLLPMLPKIVHKAFNYILPAIFGALFVNLSEKYFKVGASTFFAALAITVAAGVLKIPNWLVGILIITSGILLARVFYQLTYKRGNR
jgi:hypothetical protein